MTGVVDYTLVVTPFVTLSFIWVVFLMIGLGSAFILDWIMTACNMRLNGSAVVRFNLFHFNHALLSVASRLEFCDVDRVLCSTARI